MEPWTSLEWTGRALRFIDQTRLPAEESHIESDDYCVVADAIRKLQIRGAPAIGVAAAYAAVLALAESADGVEAAHRFEEAVDLLTRTRPTAINLFSSLKRMQRAFDEIGVQTDPQVIREHLVEEAKEIEREERESSRLIADFGISLIRPGSSLLTHCNTGELAAPGGGTALNIIIEAGRRGLVSKIFVDETRPLLQGARLTAWELKRCGMEPTLITDNTAGFLMQQGAVDGVIVGADRIAMNGDVANKIGTYSLAVLAHRHEVPFYVAAPVSTIDPDTLTGSEIPIEERPPDEITHIFGRQIAPDDVGVYSPAFDVTPHSLIRAIVTNRGVTVPPYNHAFSALFDESERMTSSR